MEKIALAPDARAGGRHYLRLSVTPSEGDEVINRKTLIGLAAVTFLLLVASAAMGEDFGEGNDLLWTLGDIVWGGFLACAVALIVMTVGVLVRSVTGSRRAPY
jgi:hypothetical protein